ncbi:MAG: CRISPR-associated protein Cas4 [Candidatus Limiplasma sp.]|nr:CRISPR-associated protein Cas4 [Candidatus Limiplasma sp.]
MTDQIALRDLQHFLYCPHRWGLMHIDCAWAENYYVVKANLLHDRVHDPQQSYTLRGRKVFTSVPVYCDLPDLMIAGVADCIEGEPSASGVALDSGGRRYNLCIVEYKPTHPAEADYHPDDAMQVFAQKVCVDSVFQCDCQAALYYADQKKRVYLPFQAERAHWEEALRATLRQMRSYLADNAIPPIPKGQRCFGCSLKDLCMPSLRQKESVREQIAREMEALP